jgi:hypothetical protein
MDQFPKLRTGAVAQYPSARERHFANEVVRFLDNSEQRYRDAGTPRRRWVIRLSRLDEGEMAELANFFHKQQGRLGLFDFEDPWTGAVVNDCRFDQDQFRSEAVAEFNCESVVTIVEPVSI